MTLRVGNQDDLSCCDRCKENFSDKSYALKITLLAISIIGGLTLVGVGIFGFCSVMQLSSMAAINTALAGAAGRRKILDSKKKRRI